MRDDCPLPTTEQGDACFVSRRSFLKLAAGLVLGAPVLPTDLEALLEKSADQLSPLRRASIRGESSFHRPRMRPNDVPLVEGKLFLTFDDGPLPCTSRILDLLSSSGHKATFFVIGRNLNDPKLRELAIRALREGHDLGNHSYDHPNFAAISPQRAVREIVSTAGLIRDVVRDAGVDANRQNLFFRFPYGVAGSRSTYTAAQEILTELKYRIAWWDVDTLDWRMELAWFPLRPAAVLTSLSRARANDVVLLHDRLKTAQCLPAILHRLDDHKLTSIPLSDVDLGAQSVPAPDKHEFPVTADRPLVLPDEEKLAEVLSQGLVGRERARAVSLPPMLRSSGGSTSHLW
jgi:peptidoglycan/xylan/chitin deacetylase (PgdA/CDA1 family)